MVCAVTGNEGDQGQKTEGTAHHVGVCALEGLLEGFGDTSISTCAHAFYQMGAASLQKLGEAPLRQMTSRDTKCQRYIS